MMKKASPRSEVLKEFEKCLSQNPKDFKFLKGQSDGSAMKTVLQPLVCPKCRIEFDTTHRFIDHLLPCQFTKYHAQKFRLDKIVDRDVQDVVDRAKREQQRTSTMEISFTDQPQLKMSIRLSSVLCKFFHQGMDIYSNYTILRENVGHMTEIDGEIYDLKFVERSKKVPDKIRSIPERKVITISSDDNDEDETDEIIKKTSHRRVTIESSSDSEDLTNVPSTSTAKPRSQKKQRKEFVEGVRQKLEVEEFQVVAPDIIISSKSRDSRATRDLANSLNMIEKAVKRKFEQSESESDSDSDYDKNVKISSTRRRTLMRSCRIDNRKARRDKNRRKSYF